MAILAELPNPNLKKAIMLKREGPTHFILRGQRLGQIVQNDGAPRRPKELVAYDLWNLRKEGEWWLFDANMPEEIASRGYKMAVSGGPVIAQTLDTLMGVFEVGGQSAALATAGGSEFPYHVFCPCDDIGPVGMAGIQSAVSTAEISPMRERTVAALVADTFIRWNMQDRRAQPLWYVRTETDSSVSPIALQQGRALNNIKVAVNNWLEAAKTYQVEPFLAAVILDIAGDDLYSSAEAYLENMLLLLSRLGDDVFDGKLSRPAPVVTVFDVGSQRNLRPEIIAAQWTLSLFHGAHHYCVAAPGYMFEVRSDGWLTDQGRRHKAEMIAAALSYEAIQKPSQMLNEIDESWGCPTPLLAEHVNNTIRVTFRSMSNLIIDESDPFDAGSKKGFQVIKASGAAGPKIIEVAICEDDPCAIELILDRAPEAGSKLAYACANTEDRARTYPSNCGSIRDDWSMISSDGSNLYRWALPCYLPIGGMSDEL